MYHKKGEQPKTDPDPRYHSTAFIATEQIRASASHSEPMRSSDPHQKRQALLVVNASSPDFFPSVHVDGRPIGTQEIPAVKLTLPPYRSTFPRMLSNSAGSSTRLFTCLPADIHRRIIQETPGRSHTSLPSAELRTSYYLPLLQPRGTINFSDETLMSGLAKVTHSMMYTSRQTGDIAAVAARRENC